MIPTPLPTLDELTAHPERAKELPPEVAADLLARMAGLQPVLLARALGHQEDDQPEARGEGDRLLTVAEAARKLGVSNDWLYRRAHRLAFTVRLGRQLRFSAVGIERWTRQRQGR
jgi:excisionase family DNA binding protein